MELFDNKSKRLVDLLDYKIGTYTTIDRVGQVLLPIRSFFKSFQRKSISTPSFFVFGRFIFFGSDNSSFLFPRMQGCIGEMFIPFRYLIYKTSIQL